VSPPADTAAIEAPAKVNLRLHVLAQQTSGYHCLETVFCAISLTDTVFVERGGGAVELNVEGEIPVGPVADNLVMRAARRFLLQRGGVGEGVRITLRKRIPSAAGLGGGSSDAAAALLALNALHGSPLSRQMLLNIGGELGSDVPFFLGHSPLALGWGRGERLLGLDPLPQRQVVLAHPGIGMPTGQAFQRIAELRGGGFHTAPRCLPTGCLATWESLAALAGNDFQEPALERLPILATALQALRRQGADIALLAGSGSAIFGLFSDNQGALAAEAALQSLGLRTWSARTLRSFPQPTLSPPESG
jgi:4-diphosphocytidyl-2-C-methyl-D-erythritol kinase